MKGAVLPSAESASQFALMLAAGVPPADAIRYFLPEEMDATSVANLARVWQRHRLVAEALTRLQGGEWVQLSHEQRIELVLRKAYMEMAYLLYSNNFADPAVHPGILARMQTARQALEAYKAGNAGKKDPFAEFIEDLRAGKYTGAKAPVQVKVGPAH